MTAADRAPVLVGAAQLLQRAADPSAAREPLLLMEDVLRAAAENAGAPALLARADSIRVTQGLWEYPNPARWLAERFGADAVETGLGLISGTSVQSMLSDAAAAIARGERDVVLLVGAEAEHSKRRARRAGTEPQRSVLEASKPDRVFGVPTEWRENPDIAAGLRSPAQAFALFEVALRHRRGESVSAHRARIGALWARLAGVAAENPNAWLRRGPGADEIATPTGENRWVAYPYTKLLVANMVVDQAAALILCSAEAARRAGVREERFVYPHASTEAVVARHISERMRLDEEPPMRIVGPRALELAGVEADALDFVDLYSCFPAAVQLGAESLGLPEERSLSVTGGLTFAGGPFNSYVMHAIATMVERLRERPGATGLVSSVGGFFSKHAFGVYGSRPPQRPFRHQDLADVVRGLPARGVSPAYVGLARIESYTVAHGRQTAPRAIVALRTEDDRRSWAASEEPELVAWLEGEDACGERVRVHEDRSFSAAPR
jgi:acetyl-CoA C-acetyltransferase